MITRVARRVADQVPTVPVKMRLDVPRPRALSAEKMGSCLWPLFSPVGRRVSDPRAVFRTRPFRWSALHLSGLAPAPGAQTFRCGGQANRCAEGTPQLLGGQVPERGSAEALRSSHRCYFVLLCLFFWQRLAEIICLPDVPSTICFKAFPFFSLTLLRMFAVKVLPGSDAGKASGRSASRFRGAARAHQLALPPSAAGHGAQLSGGGRRASCLLPLWRNVLKSSRERLFKTHPCLPAIT